MWRFWVQAVVCGPSPIGCLANGLLLLGVRPSASCVAPRVKQRLGLAAWPALVGQGMGSIGPLSHCTLGLAIRPFPVGGWVVPFPLLLPLVPLLRKGGPLLVGWIDP